MAQISNDLGVPTVAADTTAPNDQQRIQANPNQFGAQIAEGAEKLGAGASQAGQFFGKAQTADAINGALTQVNQHLNDFRALNGRAAMDAQPATQAAIDAAFKSGRDALQTPEQQLQYDEDTRSYQQRYVSGIMASHYDTQQKAYASETNNNSIKNALDGVTIAADDPTKVAGFLGDARAAVVKNLQISGNANDPGAVKAAISKADQAVYKTWIESVAVKDPVKAQAMAEKYKAGLGDAYIAVADGVRSRADQQAGQDFGLGAFHKTTSSAAPAGTYTNPSSPIFARAASEIPGGFTPQGAARTIQLESGGRNVVNASGHGGIAQFALPTFARYGQGSMMDPEQSVLAMQRYAAANRPGLERVLGRPATDADLYLAHQQGPGGAAKLLANPNARAGDLVGDKAISQNGGDPNAPASAFTSLWAAKFGGHGVPVIVPGGGQAFQLPAAAQPFAAPDVADAGGIAAPPLSVPGALPPPPEATAAPAAPTEEAPAPATSPKADAYKMIDDAYADGKLTYAAAEHARQTVNQQFAQKQISDAEDEKAKKAANEKAMGSYVSAMLNGHMPPDFIHQIANDPNLTPATKWELGQAAERRAGSDVEEAQRNYGPGFWNAYKQITAGPDDPNRVSDPTALLKRAGPGGDLTLSGVSKLQETMARSLKSVNDQAVTTTKTGLYNYAKSQLSFEQDAPAYPGAQRIRDPKGEALFNAQFIPRYESAVDAWEKAGKDPWDPSPNNPLTKAGVDKLIEGLRPKAQMERDKIFATAETSTGPANDPLPPPPSAAINPTAWAKAVAAPPENDKGSGQWTHAAWAQVLNELVNNPSPENIAAFNSSKFGRQGYDGAEIVRQLSPSQADLHRGPTNAPAPIVVPSVHPPVNANPSHGRGTAPPHVATPAEMERFNALPDIAATKPVGHGTREPPSLQKPHDKLPLGRGMTQ